MSNAVVQNLLVGLVMLAAAGYLVRRAWVRPRRARAPQSGPCGPNCGCDG